jgi:nuclear pore complex protein Nup188
LVLANTLVRTGILINRPASQLESYLFKVSPLVARLYAIDKTYHLHVIKLLEALVLSASSRDSEPPSLLGHLGPTTSKHFIRTVLDLDQPLDEERNVIAVWHMLSVVISSRQQWFSMYLLTGRPPRQSVTNGPADSGNAQARTLLRTALTALSTIENVPLPRALAMLQFISLAQNFWPWAMSDIQLKKYNFISSIMQFVDSLEAGLRIAKAEQSLEVCYKTRMAAYIAEILAMYVYHARQMGDSTPKGELLPHIGFYVALGASAPLYNPSLHGNFRGNFQNKFIGCSVQNFKRTKLEIREYGRKYFYDLDLAGRMLRSDKAWTGLKGDGLAEEMARANVNLSVVDAQVVSIQIHVSNTQTNMVRPFSTPGNCLP